MVGIQNFLGLGDLDLSAGSLRPGQHREPLDVVARQRVIGRHRRHARQAAQFLERLFLYVVGHARVFDFFLQVFHIALAFVLFAQFFLDRLHLLAQVILALRLLHAILHFALNLVAQLLHFQLFGQVLIDFLQPHPDIDGFQRFLLIGRGKRGQRRCDKIHQAARFVDVQRHGRKFIRKRGRTRHNLLEKRQHIALQGFDLGTLRRRRLGHRRNLGTHEGHQLRELAQPYPFQAFGKHEQALVGHLHHLMHHRRSAHQIQIAGLRVVDARLALRHHHNGLVFSERVDQLHRTLPAHRQRQHGVGEQNRVPDRKYRDSTLIVCFLRLSLVLGSRLLAHGLSLSVTRSSLDDAYPERFHCILRKSRGQVLEYYRCSRANTSSPKYRGYRG